MALRGTWRRTELQASVLAGTGETLNITRALLRLVGGLPSHFLQSKGIFISLVTRCNNTDLSHCPELVPSNPYPHFVLLTSPDSAIMLPDLILAVKSYDVLT